MTSTASSYAGAPSRIRLTAVSMCGYSTARSGGSPSGTGARSVTGATNALACGSNANTRRPSHAGATPSPIAATVPTDA